MAESIDFDPVDGIGVGAVGAPGHRQFFLRASSGTRTVILSCEKYHVQGLVARIQQILESQGKELEQESGGTAPAESGQAEWTIGELGLGFHESKGRFVIVARERASGEGEAESESEESAEDLATARLWVGEPEMRRFLAQAADLLQAGRPLCPYCGLPIDPSGHPCPAANGSRPIV